MKSIRVAFSGYLLTAALSLMASGAMAQVPSLINYQGRLLDNTNLANSAYELSLRLFDAARSGKLLHEDSRVVIAAELVPPAG